MNMTDISAEQWQRHAAQIRVSGILGRSDLMLRLFDFLVECALSKRVPKEIEIAMAVFGKSASFDVGQDAVVRVYVFKLRRRLTEYYLRDDVTTSDRLYLLKGEYKLIFMAGSSIVADQSKPVEQIDAVQARSIQRMPVEQVAGSFLNEDDVKDNALFRNNLKLWRRAVWLLSSVLVISIMVMVVAWQGIQQSGTPLASVRQHPVWADLLDDDLPIYVVVGDYYIFGELSDDSVNVRRLVRDFEINSVHGLEQYLKQHPEQAGRYADLTLKYLPVSVAFALHEVLPLLEVPQANKRVYVVLASDLTLSMMRSAHVVYVGLVSGMGMLRQWVFEGSQVRIGDNFDEMVDVTTGKRYVSEESMAGVARQAYKDYGYFATRTGSAGNQIIILAGTRDVALQYVAETVTKANGLESISKQVGAKQNIEGLYSVRALDGSSMGGELFLAHRFAKPSADMVDMETR